MATDTLDSETKQRERRYYRTVLSSKEINGVLEEGEYLCKVENVETPYGENVFGDKLIEVVQVVKVIKRVK